MKKIGIINGKKYQKENIMKPKEKIYDVAILVGRFQVHELHEAHKDLIKSVIDRHERVIIFLGLSRVRNTKRNPLDFNARKQMINEEFPDIEIHYINDSPSDKSWSRDLDSQIKRWTAPDQTVLLYGGRDSFISHYHGKFPTCELEPEVYVSGTKLRKTISQKTMDSKDFRAGAIWASYNRYDISLTTVDVAIIDGKDRLLLGKKLQDNGLYRFVGGFSDVNSSTLEADAKREVSEETGLEVSEPKYICSMKINDWRYKNETDKIKTTFWLAEYIHGQPIAGDDLDEIKWFDLSIGPDELKKQVIKIHHGLVDKLYERLG